MTRGKKASREVRSRSVPTANVPIFDTLEPRLLLDGTIEGQIWEDINGDGLRNACAYRKPRPPYPNSPHGHCHRGAPQSALPSSAIPTRRAFSGGTGVRNETAPCGMHEAACEHPYGESNRGREVATRQRG